MSQIIYDLKLVKMSPLSDQHLTILLYYIHIIIYYKSNTRVSIKKLLRGCVYASDVFDKCLNDFGWFLCYKISFDIRANFYTIPEQKNRKFLFVRWKCFDWVWTFTMCNLPIQQIYVPWYLHCNVLCCVGKICYKRYYAS